MCDRVSCVFQTLEGFNVFVAEMRPATSCTPSEAVEKVPETRDLSLQ